MKNKRGMIPVMSKEVITKENKFENATTWLHLGIDLDSRRIQLDMEVSEVMASLVIRSLLKMSDISKDPIEIYLSSFGGEIYAGLSIYDAIRACPCDVIIYANGKIMSAGLLIFLAGDVRLASPHTTFMAHSVSFGSEGKLKDIEVDVTEGKRLNNVMLDILAERTKKPRKLWYRLILSHDKFFNLTEAREYGLISKSEEKGQNKNGITKRPRRTSTKKPTVRGKK